MATDLTQASGRHLVLWDGACGMCRRYAEWGTRRDRAGRLRFVPYQEAPSPPMTPALADACERSIHVIRSDGGMLRGGRAILFVWSELGIRWPQRLFGWPPMIWLVELGYLIVARNRHVFSRLLFRPQTG